MFWKSKQERCKGIVESVISDDVSFHIWLTRVRDSLLINEGNINNVYNEIATAISNEYDVHNKKVCMRASMAIVTLLRMSVNRYEDLDFKYHG